MKGRALARWRRAFREIAESAGAAGLAWWLGTLIFGSHQPVFAAIAAVVCLAPGLPSHSSQALGMLGGVFAGIVMGQAVMLLPLGGTGLGIAVAVFCAMMIGIAFRVKPIIGIQSGASAILVIAGDDSAGGLVRMGDAAIGGVVALTFSQVLFSPDPAKVIGEAADDLLGKTRDAKQRLEALEEGRSTDRKGRSELNTALAELRDAEAAFVSRLDYADNIAHRTLRGRLRRERIEKLTDEWREIARQVHLALGSAGYALEEESAVGKEAAKGLDDADDLLTRAFNRLEG